MTIPTEFEFKTESLCLSNESIVSQMIHDNDVQISQLQILFYFIHYKLNYITFFISFFIVWYVCFFELLNKKNMSENNCIEIYLFNQTTSKTSIMVIYQIQQIMDALLIYVLLFLIISTFILLVQVGLILLVWTLKSKRTSCKM